MGVAVGEDHRPAELLRPGQSVSSASVEQPSNGSSCQMIITAGLFWAAAVSKAALTQSTPARSDPAPLLDPFGPGTLTVAKTTLPIDQRAFSTKAPPGGRRDLRWPSERSEAKKVRRMASSRSPGSEQSAHSLSPGCT